MYHLQQVGTRSFETLLATKSGSGHDAAFHKSRRRGVLPSQLWHSPTGRRGRSMQVSYDPSLLSSTMSFLLQNSTEDKILFVTCNLCYLVKRTTDWTERRGISLRTVIIRLFVMRRGFVGTRRVGRMRSVHTSLHLLFHYSRTLFLFLFSLSLHTLRHRSHYTISSSYHIIISSSSSFHFPLYLSSSPLVTTR
jgi:hypothetical protein